MRLRRLLPVTVLAVALAATPAAAQPGHRQDRAHEQGEEQRRGHGKRALAELGLPEPGAPADAVENYTLIESELLLPHPEEWGGAYVDGKKLVVNTVTRSVDEARAELHRIGVRGAVDVRQVAVSVADLEAASDAALADDAVADALSSIGPDYSRSRVLVGMRSDVDSDAAVLRLDDVSAELAAADPSGATVPLEAYDGGTPPATASRYYDTSSFYGGNYVHFSGAAGTRACSTGFSWVADSVTYLVSASHCSVSSSDDRYSTVKRIASSAGATYKIGTVTWRSGGAAGTSSGRRGDIAMVKIVPSMNAAARVYTGTYNTSKSLVVKGRVSLPQGWKGTNLRTSAGGGPANGLGDGEINPNWISLVNQTVKYSNNQTYKNLTVAEHVSDCTRSGDSGGAFYVIVSGAAKGVGIISGSGGGGAGPTNCRNYYTPLGFVAADFGGRIKTG